MFVFNLFKYDITAIKNYMKNRKNIVNILHNATPFSYVPKGFTYVRAHICTGIICELTNSVNEKLKSLPDIHLVIW